jgi:hypothetical protein
MVIRAIATVGQAIAFLTMIVVALMLAVFLRAD